VDEIPRLAIEFVQRFCRESNKPQPIPISDAAMAVLKSYPWPGNVRELRNVIERAVVFCKSIAIAPEHLGLPVDRISHRPPPMQQQQHDPAAFAQTAFANTPPPYQPPGPHAPTQPPGPPGSGHGQTQMGSQPPFPVQRPGSQPAFPVASPHGAAPGSQPPFAAGNATVAFGSSLPSEVDALERERILAVLAQCGGNQTQAAEMLGISRRTLLRRLDEYAVPRPRK
jgi:two-component system, NtrC family, response regulator AtoC